LDLPLQNANSHCAQEGEEEFFGGRSTPSEKTATTASAQLQHTIKKSTPTRTLSEDYYKTKFHLQNQSILSQQSNNKLVTNRLTTILILKMNLLPKAKSNSDLDFQDIDNNASVS
jgi:hypothetical protein